MCSSINVAPGRRSELRVFVEVGRSSTPLLRYYHYCYYYYYDYYYYCYYCH